MRHILILFIVSLSLVLTSCFKDDKRVTPHIAGNYITDTIALTSSYKNQIFYNLHDSAEVSTLLKTSWDLGFENSPTGWHVIVNSSCFMKTTLLTGQTFGSAADTIGKKWIFNPSDGSADSLVAGRWFELRGNDTIGSNRLLLVDRGIDENGNPRGYRQLIIDSLRLGTYYFRVADMNGANSHSFSVNKHGNSNYILFSFSNPASAPSEPDNSTWDLLFSQYTTLLYTDAGAPYPYLVTGVVLNPNSVEVAVDSLTPFANITFDIAQNMSFSKHSDRIGYNWKRYSFSSGSYTVNSDIVYVIRDTKGYLYKLRFIGFYKYAINTLEKGYPSFEYQKL